MFACHFFAFDPKFFAMRSAWMLNKMLSYWEYCFSLHWTRRLDVIATVNPLEKAVAYAHVAGGGCDGTCGDGERDDTSDDVASYDSAQRNSQPQWYGVSR